jgi:hypothetical protein
VIKDRDHLFKRDVLLWVQGDFFTIAVEHNSFARVQELYVVEDVLDCEHVLRLLRLIGGSPTTDLVPRKSLAG